MLHNMASHIHQATAAVLSTMIHQPWIASATLACGLVAYYCLSVVKVPELVSKPTSEWTQFLLSNVPVLTERFWCSAWCYEARAQTIAATVINAGLTPLKYNREIIQLSDGGQLSLDWIKEENPAPKKFHSGIHEAAQISDDRSIASKENIAVSSICGPTKPENNHVEMRNGCSPTKSNKNSKTLKASPNSSLNIHEQQNNISIKSPMSYLKDVTDLSGSEDSGCGSDQSTCNDSDNSKHPCDQNKVNDLTSEADGVLSSGNPPRSHSRDPSSDEDSQDSTLSEQSRDFRTLNSIASSTLDSSIPPRGKSSGSCRLPINAENDPRLPSEATEGISNDSKSGEPSEFTSLDADKEFPITDQPLLVVLPGLTGSSESEYVKDFVRAGQASGYKCFVFNNRGKGGVTLKTPRTYCAANCDDFAEAIEQIVARYRRERDSYRQQLTSHPQQSNSKDGNSGNGKGQRAEKEVRGGSEAGREDNGGERYKNDAPMIVAVGISLGGMIVCHYLSGRSAKAAQRLTAAVGVSVPYNVFIGTDSLEKPVLNLALNRHLAKCLVDSVVELKYMLQDSKLWDYHDVLKARTIRQFDARFTSVQFGYEDVNAYYTSASLHNKMHSVRVPYLGISSSDDPFQPRAGLPSHTALESDHVALCVTSRGGHIGFLEGMLGQCWSARLIQQLLTAVIQNPEMMEKIKFGQQ